MSVDLTKAKPGDRFEARDGRRYIYSHIAYHPGVLCHIFYDAAGSFVPFRQDGGFAIVGETAHDLIRAIDIPSLGADLTDDIIEATIARFDLAARNYATLLSPDEPGEVSDVTAEYRAAKAELVALIRGRAA